MPHSKETSLLEWHYGPRFAGEKPEDGAMADLTGRFTTEHPGRLLEYWLALCPPGDVPARADVQPSDIKRLLERLSIFERTPSGVDSTIRLMGSLVADLFDRDPTGETVAAVFPADWAEAFNGLNPRLYDEKRPLFLCYSLEPLGRSYAMLEHLALPLRNQHEAAEMALNVFARIPPVPGGVTVLG